MKLSKVDIVSSNTNSSFKTFYENIIFEVDAKEELDFSIEEIEAEFLWNAKDRILEIPQGRSEYIFGKSTKIDSYCQRINKKKELLLDYIYNLPKEDFFKFQRHWFQEQKELNEKIELGTLILKDSPGFEMCAHLDNKIVFGVLVINLVDNSNGTTFYSLLDDSKIIYEAPAEKGKGVFFLNLPGALHGVKNSSMKDRYISYSTFNLKNLTDSY